MPRPRLPQLGHHHGRPEGSAFPSDSALDGLSSLNNELIDTQRDLAKRNSTLTFALARNLAKLRQAVKAKRQAEEQLRFAAEAAGLGTFSYDHAKGVGTYSSELLSLFGLEVGDEVALSQGLVPAAVVDADRFGFQSAIAASNDPLGDGSMQTECRILRPDGSLRWLMVRGRTSFAGSSADRRPVRSAGVAIDITDRKLAEGARDREAAVLQAAASSMVDGLIIYAEDGRITHASRTAERIFDLSPQTLGLPFGQRLAKYAFEGEDGRPIAPQQLSVYTALMPGEAVSGAVIGLRQGSQLTWLSCGVAPIRTADGERLGAVFTFSDITEARNARLGLERLLAGRTEFLAMCSHELKTPLTVLRANAELFQRMFDSLDGQQRAKFLSSMVTQSRKLDRLVVDLLDVSRIERGYLTIDATPTRLNQLVGRVVSDFASACLTHSVAAPILAECVASVDPGRFEQMLLNLLTNAAKFSEQRTKITVRMAVDDGCVEVSVADEGHGIPEANIARLFEPYYRVPGSGVASGLGIGLYVTMELARLHGGTVAVKSTEGMGSAFALRLPLTPPGSSRSLA